MSASPARGPDRGLVHVVDDDADLAASVSRLLRRHGFAARPFSDPAAWLAVETGIGARDPANGPVHCIVTDIMMGDMNGFAFADAARARDPHVAIVFITAWPTTAGAVDAVRRHGGLDYLDKPIDEARLVAAVAEGCAWSAARRVRAGRLAALSPRERDVFALLVRGHRNKAVATMLGLSEKTVEDHRAAVLAKTGATGIAELIALAT